MKPRALWIEDSARLELANLCGPVLFNGTYNLTLAEDVTSAVALLQADPFDAIIVDIRLPPGGDRHWREQYKRTGSDKVSAQLGLKLLRWLLRGDDSIYPKLPPSWVRPHHVGVFTVETRTEVSPFLDELGIKVFQEKIADLPDTVLQDLIDRLVSNEPKGSPRPEQTERST